MVSPKTRGIRGRGTLLKKKAFKGLSGGLIALICALFSIGITMEGISINNILTQPFNLLSIIGIVGGSSAIIAGIGLYREGHRLQNYWRRRRSVKQMFKIRDRKTKRKKSKKQQKQKKKKKIDKKDKKNEKNKNRKNRKKG
jgi:hypothetical protein